MLRVLTMAGALVVLSGTGLSAVFAQSTTDPAPTATAAAPKYSTNSTQLGTLLADPAAKAVLATHIPELVSGPRSQDMEQASGMTLTELRDAIKAYAPDVLSDDVLAKIDGDLSKLP